jgi:hypothetical protein
MGKWRSIYLQQLDDLSQTITDNNTENIIFSIYHGSNYNEGKLATVTDCNCTVICGSTLFNE